MSVRAVKNNGIDSFRYQRGHPFERVSGDADSGSHPEPSSCILAGLRIKSFLDEVLVGDKSHDTAFSINHRKFLHFVALEHVLDV